MDLEEIKHLLVLNEQMRRDIERLNMEKECLYRELTLMREILDKLTNKGAKNEKESI